MSAEGTTGLLFEGFLQKRKDTLKIRWVTYWFRLQNTTLFFYTKKNGSAAHLRGYYYIYTVQSVREIHKADRKRFMFEIIMNNGKTKVLAADTAALRKEWVGNLWQAMNLSGACILTSRRTQLDVCEKRDRFNSSTPACSDRDSEVEVSPGRPLSAPVPPDHFHAEATTSPISQPQDLHTEEAAQQNPLPACYIQNPDDDGLGVYQWSADVAEDGGDGVYDILPCRNTISAEVDDCVYDVPMFCRRSAEYQESEDTVYDVPSSLLRKISDHTIDEQPEEETYWRI
ncbi:uncharacterized protein LOC114439476 isoform X2 [Parambassis ranga]|uniref:Uncharacterized protein LOC114439476 isoform X2 n=1 Tax=Parambassis ranga TaxID=210632 RepID=A0A6P7INZ7_9TELE|nr:uncharacterized protein LOC114439476 isoform X2 [Parambassis ranga]